MFHRGPLCFATAALFALSSPVFATQYDISTRADEIKADGFCSLREAVEAINTQLGYIGNVRSDERGVTLIPSVLDEPRLTMTKEVRNVSRSGSFSVAGTRLIANRGDILEYRIKVEAQEDAGNVTDVRLAFEFPHEDATVWDPDTGTWRSYISAYLPESSKLNGADVDDVDGFPFKPSAPQLINDSPVGDEEIVEGTIREGRSAEIVFRVRVEEGADEAVSTDLPEEDASGEDRIYLVEAECPAGTLSNTINLKSVAAESEDLPVQYQLSQGPLSIDGVSTGTSVTLQSMKDDAFDREAKKNIEIRATQNERIFDVSANATLSLSGITLAGNEALPAGQNGGLILSLGSLEFREGSILRDGHAEHGGALYVDGNRNVVFQNAFFLGNVATAGNGGAIATASSFQGDVIGERFYFEGNSATGVGGALYLGGLTPELSLQNGTFYGNSAVDGAAIRLAANNGVSAMNNVTIAGNTASAGVALSYRDVVGDGRDWLFNSVLVGNIGGDCSADDGPATPGSNLTLDLAEIAYVISVGAGPDTPSCGPLDAEFVSEGGETFDYSLVGFGLLVGRHPVNTSSDERYVCGGPDVPPNGPDGCRPIEFDDGLKGFLPNNDATYSAAPAAGHIGPSVVSAGSPEDAVSYVCQPKDQRDLDREPRCDAGAVELQIAAGQNDEFRIVQGQQVLLDVLANDMGDLSVDCQMLGDPLACMGFFLPPRQTEFMPLIWVSGQVAASNPDALTEVVVVEDREGVYLNRAPVGDEEGRVFPQGYPMVLHTSLSTFHGVDQFRYFLDRDAVSGSVYAGANPSANANLVVEPPSGLANKGDVTTLSGGVGWSILALLGLIVRRFRLSMLLLLAFSAHAQAADIIVNTTLDSATPQNGVFDRDGLCSLREALLVSIDRSPFFFPDCAPGATGRDRIIIDVEGTIELAAVLEVSSSAVDIEGQGPEITIIQPAAGNQHRIFIASSSLLLKNLTIAGGRSLENGGAIFTSGNLTLENVELRDNQAVGSGGAIYLNFNAELRRQLAVRRSYIHGNTAGANGGVVSMVGQNEQHDLFFDAVTFAGNSAPLGAGGVLDVNLPQGGSLRVLNSTFVNNSAVVGAAVDMQQMAETTTAYLLNSTLVDNTATSVAAGAGAIEGGDSLGGIFLANSIYIGSGGCGSGSARFRESYFNVFSAPRPSTCVAPVLADVANSEVAEADVRAVINDAVLVAGIFSEGRYTPPHLPIVSEARGDTVNYPAGVFIIDAGNDDLELVSNDSTPRACRALDLRGGSRESGGRCDVGAHELQVPTAIDDEASNRTRSSRSIRFDVLFNDLAGDGVPGGAGIVENTVLTGTIDLDPSTPGVTSEKNVSVDLDEGDDEDLRDFRISKVTNGSWVIDNTAEQLDEGVYELVAVLRNSDDGFISSARQTVIVRNSAVLEEEDDFVVSSSSSVRISGIDGDDGDFVVSDGRLQVHGLSDAEAGSTVELFIDDRSVGEEEIEEGGLLCGGEVGFDGEDDDCIVYIEPLSELSCEDIADEGLKVAFPYSFHVFNGESVVSTESTTGSIAATITNVAPRFKGEDRRSIPGRVEVFRLELADPDLADDQDLPLFDSETINVNTKSRLKLNTAPKFAATVIRELNIDGPELLQLVYGIEGYGAIDPESEVYASGTDGLGLLVRQVEPGVLDVIYTPRDNEGQFNDRFVLGYEDECGAVATAEFRIIYPEANGLAGSYGPGGLIALLVLLGRRRQRRR